MKQDLIHRSRRTRPRRDQRAIYTSKLGVTTRFWDLAHGSMDYSEVHAMLTLWRIGRWRTVVLSLGLADGT